MADPSVGPCRTETGGGVDDGIRAERGGVKGCGNADIVFEAYACLMGVARKCLGLLQGPSDERRFAGLLLLRQLVDLMQKKKEEEVRGHDVEDGDSEECKVEEVVFDVELQDKKKEEETRLLERAFECIGWQFLVRLLHTCADRGVAKTDSMSESGRALSLAVLSAFTLSETTARDSVFGREIAPYVIEAVVEFEKKASLDDETAPDLSSQEDLRLVYLEIQDALEILVRISLASEANRDMVAKAPDIEDLLFRLFPLATVATPMVEEKIALLAIGLLKLINGERKDRYTSEHALMGIVVAFASQSAEVQLESMPLVLHVLERQQAGSHIGMHAADLSRLFADSVKRLLLARLDEHTRHLALRIVDAILSRRHLGIELFGEEKDGTTIHLAVLIAQHNSIEISVLLHDAPRAGLQATGDTEAAREVVAQQVLPSAFGIFEHLVGLLAEEEEKKGKRSGDDDDAIHSDNEDDSDDDDAVPTCKLPEYMRIPCLTALCESAEQIVDYIKVVSSAGAGSYQHDPMFLAAVRSLSCLAAEVPDACETFLQVLPAAMSAGDGDGAKFVLPYLSQMAEYIQKNDHDVALQILEASARAIVRITEETMKKKNTKEGYLTAWCNVVTDLAWTVEDSKSPALADSARCVENLTREGIEMLPSALRLEIIETKQLLEVMGLM